MIGRDLRVTWLNGMSDRIYKTKSCCHPKFFWVLNTHFRFKFISFFDSLNNENYMNV